MASQTLTLKASGLQTNYQTLMDISPGALLKANNTVINREGIIEPRRGFKEYYASDAEIKQLLEYKTRIISHSGTELKYDNGSGTFTPFVDGSSTPISIVEPTADYRVKYAEAKSNLYFTTSEGVKKISARTPSDFSILNVVEDCGGPKAIAGSTSLIVGTVLPNNSRVSYRILWIYTDRNDNLIFGAPSAPMTVSNTSGGARNVQLTFQVPYDVNTTDYKYRIYRSEAIDLSVFPNAVPSDELYQVYEATVTLANIAAGSVTVTDTLAEDLRLGGVPLYTNQNSGEGILKSNEPPPAALDIALFKGHMFYANTRTRYSTTFTLSSIAGLSGQTITIGSNVYTFGAVENPATKQVLVGASIEATANSLVRVINGDANEIVSAYYLSVFGETPGKVLLQRKTLVNTPYNTSSSIGANFTPNLTTPLASTNEVVGNRLYYSKYQEHEAVPLLNYIDIGSKDQPITRIISLRESLFVFKDDGVFRLAGDPGTNPTWDVGAFDNTSFLKGPDTAITLGNQCYYFSNQGVMRLNESSLENISKPIDDKLLSLLAVNTNIQKVSFAVGYESQKSLLLWTVLTRDDTKCRICYRYNTVTQTWTEWQITKTCAIVSDHVDKLFLGSINPIPEIELENYSIEIERKDFNRFDYADREYIINLNTFSLNDTLMNLSQIDFKKIGVGDVLVQEQYVTIYQFNSLLKKLDLDNGLPSNDYYDTLKLSSGQSLTLQMASLVAKLNIDDPASAYTFSGSLNFATIQIEFNAIVNKLNASSVAYFTNYQRSGLDDTGLFVAKITRHEAIVVATERIRNRITLNVFPSFILGPIRNYKAISTEVEYAPQHAGDPASFKQFTTGMFMFKRRSFYFAQIGYNSDVSDNYEEIDFTEKNAGIFGGTEYGNGSTWGGSGDQANIRTYIPLKKQRGRFLGCKFYHVVALESFELYGLAISYRPYNINDRDYR